MRKLLGFIWGTAFLVALWWGLAILVNSPALPTPAATWPVFVETLPTLWPEACTSFYRIFVSMAIGTLLGAPAGLALGRSRVLDTLFSGVLYVLYPIPKIVFLPVLFLLFGLGGEAKIILITIAVFFQIMVTMRDAAKNLPPAIFDSMRSLGAGPVQTFVHVTLPATLPDLFTALRITTGTVVAMLFIAESMAGSTGLGYLIMHSWSLLYYNRMFAGILAMVAMGVTIYEFFDLLEKHAVHR